VERKGVPLYVQLEQIIKSQIITGELLPGEQIPTEKDLSETYHVSSITSRQAILNLVSEGLLTRKQGKGTFVTETLPDLKNILTLHLRGDIHEIVPEGLTAQKVELLDMITMKVPKRVARLLHLADGEEVVRVKRTRSENEIPISYVKNYLPLEIGEKINRADLSIYPMLDILRNQLGIPLRRGTQYIGAIVADYDIASALSAAISSPILYQETLIFAGEDEPVEFVQTFYRADHIRFTVKLDLEDIRSV
jgi:GntR family transcriptional regulator